MAFKRSLLSKVFRSDSDEEEKEVQEEMVYNYIDENMPDWAKPTVQKLIAKGALKGDEKGQLMLTGTMLRLFVIHDRMGVYDK